MTAETIIKKIDKNYASFIRLYRSLPVTTLELEALPNGWTVKDLLGHIAAWEWHCAESLNQARQSGGLPSVSIDFNELNRKIYEERKDWPWADIEVDFRAAHEAVIAAIRQFPTNRLDQEAVQHRITVDTWQHYADHVDELQAWHRRQTRKR
jgi:hypothetical protein